MSRNDMNARTLSDLMPDAIDYPHPTRQPLVDGVCYQYISSTHLDGWINYVKTVAAFAVTRYSDDGDAGNRERVAKWHEAPPYHTKLRDICQDDIYILARCEYDPTDWWVFEYDCDVSDCRLGRFTTDMPESDVRALFDSHVKENADRACWGYSGRAGEPIPIDASKIKGWVSW